MRRRSPESPRISDTWMEDLSVLSPASQSGACTREEALLRMELKRPFATPTVLLLWCEAHGNRLLPQRGSPPCTPFVSAPNRTLLPGPEHLLRLLIEATSQRPRDLRPTRWEAHHTEEQIGASHEETALRILQDC
ncbi:uncharacterized protein LOC144382288 isoform X1 [Halichoerus grypus]